MAHTLKIVYFAWVKERLGRDGEFVELDNDVRTVGDLIGRMSSRDPAFETVLKDTGKLRFALDQNFVDLNASIDGADELAIFPPVTGG
ncbi:molybdopterin converting factor subunit 1 [Parasphingorhabdus sp.]|uniref:molybdopterin converting factor subunit 1 n=1 Tax=Parasphingorhabdus sp. TaxID=2709688 RepID=UPI0032645B7A